MTRYDFLEVRLVIFSNAGSTSNLILFHFGQTSYELVSIITRYNFIEARRMILSMFELT